MSVIVLSARGALRALLEAQWNRSNPERVRFLQPSRGLTYAWRAAAPWGKRIDPASLLLDGAPVQPEGRFRPPRFRVHRWRRIAGWGSKRRGPCLAWRGRT